MCRDDERHVCLNRYDIRSICKGVTMNDCDKKDERYADMMADMYDKEKRKAFIIGRVLGNAEMGHRNHAEVIIRRYPEIFKDVISAMDRGDVGPDYKFRDLVVQFTIDELGIDHTVLGYNSIKSLFQREEEN